MQRGSKEEYLKSWVDFLAKTIDDLPGFEDDIIVDDRDTLTIGKRVIEAKKTGYPFVIVVGKNASNSVPQFELIDTVNNNTHMFTHVQLLDFLRNKIFA